VWVEMNLVDVKGGGLDDIPFLDFDGIFWFCKKILTDHHYFEAKAVGKSWVVNILSVSVKPPR
jgi:hypothetical protein